MSRAIRDTTSVGSPIAVRVRRHPRRDRALSLVEVLASIMLVGGSVTGMLVVQARGMAELKEGRLALQADELAKEKLHEWQLTGEPLPESKTGGFSNLQRWTWRRESERAIIAPNLESTVVTLTLIRAGDRWERPWTRKYRWLESDK